MALTKIEWAKWTFNPWIGCTKVDEICDNCYAEGEDKRRGWTPEGWGAGKPRHRTTAAYWRQPLRWNAEAETHQWFRCAGCEKAYAAELATARQCTACGGWLIEQRPRVFCASLADVFDAEVPDQWRWDLMELIRTTPRLDWLLLTKRPHLARTFLPQVPFWPIPNVWLGTSVGTQAGYEKRVLDLIRTPARVHFLSMEPLIEAVRFEPLSVTGSLVFEPLRKPRDHFGGAGRIDWVIAGGESGPKARPTHPQWVRDVRDACAANDVPFFFKQWGEWAHDMQFDGVGQLPKSITEYPSHHWLERQPASGSARRPPAGNSTARSTTAFPPEGCADDPVLRA